MKLALALSALFLITACASKGTKPEAPAAAGQPAAAPAKADNKAAAPAKAEKAAKRAADSKGADSDATVSEKASCKSGGDERLIEIVTRGSGCAVEYTKQNEKSEIATAAHETQHCTNVMQKVKGKLEAAGFSCN